MAKVFLASQSYANGALVLFNLKAQLKVCGWVVLRSSDGTTFNASGDQITTGASGANGMDNNNAWFVIQQPAVVNGVRRQLMFMRGQSGPEYWTISQSYSVGYVGGSATVPATATDSIYVYGTEVVNGSPMFAAGNQRTHIMCDDASPYQWWLNTHSQATTTVTCFIAMDYMVAGSQNALDDDPYVYVLATGGNLIYNSVTNGSSALMQQNAAQGATGCFGWFKRGLAGATWVNVAQLLITAGGNQVYQGQGQNGYVTRDDIFPIMYGRGGGNGAFTQPFIKGTSSILFMMGTNRASQDTLTVSTTRDHLVIGPGMAVAWNGTIPTL